MTAELTRRNFIKDSLTATAAGALALHAGAARAADAAPAPAAAKPPAAFPTGRIGELQISRMLLGGNLLTHYTHSRDLKYVYSLTAHYNTEAKIIETLSIAEAHGINTLTIHNPPAAMSVLRKHRREGGKIQWIICPTAPVAGDLHAYTEQVKELVDNGCEAIYLWGVHADPLAAAGKMDLITRAVEIAKEHGVPSGVGAHDLNVIAQCEKSRVPADFYIKTFHHHHYPSGPRPEQLVAPLAENPGYWCKDPQATIELMKTVEKPWIAFKVMAAGAIPPKDALTYAFSNGADHCLAGMFDFEIAEDAAIARGVLADVKRERPWRS